jgi:hypothetical protein
MGHCRFRPLLETTQGSTAASLITYLPHVALAFTLRYGVLLLYITPLEKILIRPHLQTGAEL